ncbi:MAG TPA: outer membrane beta-barrel protein [Flavobacterium sp.]|nr:outer membrane beta-barrel protein [Flavobacterium sp.]
MYRIFFGLFCSFFFYSAASQNIKIQGKVVDNDVQGPIEAATVYLSSVADSTLIDYTITDKNGLFLFNTKKIEKPVYLKVSYMGFKNFVSEHPSITENKDFGTLKLSPQDNLLGEVVVISEAPPIRIKNDTLEFNAASFKIRPDANVETLLKQLPGIEIDADGKITVNGKEVNQILVNGKPFFDKDGKIALQNLPSEIINKVQITDTKTKKEELAGQAASSNNASINLTIDEDKNKGLFGKFMGGYGSDERYESSVLVNYFKNKTKLSVLAASNNINSTGFSANEVFDSMGGGRNASMNSFGNGSFSINGLRFGGGSGITTSNMVGLNYADEWFKDFDIRTSYFINGIQTENQIRTRAMNLLPEGSITTESAATSEDDQTNSSYNVDLEYKIDSTTTVFVAPKFTSRKSKFKNSSNEFSTDESDRLLNENIEEDFDDSNNTTFSNSIVFSKVLRNDKRVLTLSVNNDNNRDDIQNLNKSVTTFYDDDDDDGTTDGTRQILRDQISINKNKLDKYSVGIEYQEPVLDSLNLLIAADYANDRQIFNRESSNFDPASGLYSVRNDSLSRELSSFTTSFSPNVGLSINKSKMNLSATLGTTITKFDNESLYLNHNVRLTREYILPSAQANANIRFSKSVSLWTNYTYNVNFPTANQILPVEDFQNPLNTVIGNQDLNPNKQHSVFMNFRNYNFTTKSGYSVYSGGNFFDSQIVASTNFNDSGKRTTTYQNVSGSYSTWIGFNWNKSIKNEAHSFRYNVSLNGSYVRNLGFTNTELYEARLIRFTPRLNFTYEYGELLTINPTYNFTVSKTEYKNYLAERASNITHRFNLQTTSYWPKHVVLGNDFEYNYNSNIADGFKKDFYLWNVSLGYNFLNDKLLAKVKVYDVLNQNQNATRTISATSIVDEENIVLQRYAMFSLTYKIEKFGGVQKQQQQRGPR